MRLLSASWVVPMESPPIEGGALLVSGDRILAVGAGRALSREWPNAKREDYPGRALFPALVNAHAHLELTALGAPSASDGFVGWLLGVIRRKKDAPPGVLGQGIVKGARECRRGGQGLIADVLSVACAAMAYPADGPEIVVYPEIIASRAERAHEAVPAVRDALRGSPTRVGGLFPHAPYTVSEEGYRLAGSALGAFDRLATHVAESEEELEFCLRGTGEIIDRLYATLGLTAPTSPGAHPIDWLDRLGALGPKTILVHCVHLGKAHFDLLKRRGCGITLCPRSNRFLNVGKAPGQAILRSGIPVALGTDSALSSGDLDLWEEVRRAVDDYGWSPEEALTAATLGGAEVLGVNRERGGFAPERKADILCLPVRSVRNLWEELLAVRADAVQWLDSGDRDASGDRSEKREWAK